jgi:hypothetical protein
MTDRPAHFYKYTSAETAAKILESSTFRYSSPLLFNDPFDVQTGLHLDFDVTQLPEKVWERIEQLVLQQERPAFAESSFMRQSIALMRDKKSTHGFPREAMRSLVLPGLSAVVSGLVDLQAQVQNLWRQNFLPRLRVFSVSENKDNLLMWSHYAKDHTGVVFELRVMPAEDNPLHVAKPVQYCRVPPPLFSEEQWIDFMLERSDLKEEAFFLEYANMKSDVWVYENEWRVWDLVSSADPPFFTAWPIFPNEIRAVYLGCRIAPDRKTEILRLLAKYPTAGAFQSRKVPDEYKIEFDAIQPVARMSAA